MPYKSAFKKMLCADQVAFFVVVFSKLANESKIKQIPLIPIGFEILHEFEIEIDLE